MLKKGADQAWVCTRCLRRSRTTGGRRHLATAAAGLVRRFYPIQKARLGAVKSDELLRDIFDSQPAWKEFASGSAPAYGSRYAGLFCNPYLTRPAGFQEYASHTLAKCKLLVHKISGYSSVGEYRGIVRDLDRLSDLLCRVIDLCEFVRSSHPDDAVQDAATQAYLTMFQYMNVLNTTPVLDQQLRKALSMPEVTTAWSEQEKVVAGILSRDFSKSAIDLPEDERKSFVELSDAASQIGSHFMDYMDAKRRTINFSSSRLQGMDPTVVRQFSYRGKVSLPAVGGPANLALRTVEDSDVRREIYLASRSASDATLRDLEELLKTRTKLARLSGFQSFSHLTLADKMAKTPEAVDKFLEALYHENVPRAGAELQELLELKLAHLRGDGNGPAIQAWDRDFYTNKLLTPMEYRVRSDHLSEYFSLGTVMQGLSRLFERLYGIRLMPRETAKGETWHPDVRRLDVVDESDGVIAVIYCDLFQRSGKSPNPAHFTIRCSRSISEEEMEEANLAQDSGIPHFDTAVQAANDGLPVGRRQIGENTTLFQLPTIALICDFAYQQPTKMSSGKPALLSFREVQTLFHEMGHAVHSVSGRTELQNVSGTRCATDFAELPSVLMEHFAAAPEVLGLYARHWETGAPLDPVLVQERLDIDKRMHGAEVEGQILMSMLDQAYHSASVVSADGGIDSTSIYHQIWNQYSSVPEPPGTTWQGFFGHLVGYGATYYAYLFDRVIAGKIWRDVFQRHPGGAIDENAGRLFRDEVLSWGGGRDGWKCIAGVLRDQDGVLAEGKDQAMEIVGKWGLKG